uniref:Ovule protein n=1 Tax=Romanomermis culicivorax TaxID=13658 RepID=A0A915KGM6_ROMCU
MHRVNCRIENVAKKKLENSRKMIGKSYRISFLENVWFQDRLQILQCSTSDNRKNLKYTTGLQGWCYHMLPKCLGFLY